MTPASRSRNRSAGIDEVERQPQLLREPLAESGSPRRTAAVRCRRRCRSGGRRSRDESASRRRWNRRHPRGRRRPCRRPDLLPDPLGRFFDERRDRPVAGAAADAVGEVPQDLERRDRCARLPDETAARTAARSGASIAAIGAVALVAATENPGGTAATSSPWLAHTRSSAGTCVNSVGWRCRCPRRARARDRTRDDPSGALPRRARRSSAASRSRCRAPACRARTASASHFGAPVVRDALRSAREDDADGILRRAASRPAC